MSESARGEGGRVWVPRTAARPAPPRNDSRSRALLLPRRALSRSMATWCRATSPPARFSTSAPHEGLSVEQDRLCVYLDLTHIPRATLDHKLGGILEIYEKFQGVDPREVPMKIFPAVHYSMGGLWVDYEAHRRRRLGDRLAAQSADQHSRPVRHRRMRLSISRRQSAGGQFAAELHFQRPDGRAGHRKRCDQGATSGRAAGRRSIERAAAAPSGDPRSAAHAAGRRRKSLSAPPGTRAR